MKKIILAITFAIAYAIFLSLGLEALLYLLCFSMAIAIDSVTARFIPFCITVGILALAALVGIFVFNLKTAEKQHMTKRICVVQTVVALVLSIPMIKPWEMLFDFLQTTF